MQIGVHRTLLRGGLGLIIEITNFQKLFNLQFIQKDVIIFHTFAWSCNQSQLYQGERKGAGIRKNRRRLAYFEVTVLVRTVLALSSLFSLELPSAP